MSTSRADAIARLLVRSYLNVRSSKARRYIFPVILCTVTAAITIFGSISAYNLFKFISPVLLVFVWVIYTCAYSGKIPIMVSEERRFSKRFIIVFYTVLACVLAAFGYGWLAICWLFIMIGVLNLHTLHEKKLKELKTKEV